ncbi:phospholipase D-like domain-containing protein [Halorubrum lipolyticum]|uniref:Phospholipase D/transphosphatidylase n=1 Tax=Halorubrum lipolyticum DSM 21995 TaxID=1227482 RepID=M0NJU9_9EURY|nr:phospholipase D-like domain-containing protein [Halorubrum lipolyticum]EMA57828.1 phospholipase D/transphosphatidylase [Halorubrum lipolyticum DSM 21995]
MSPDSPRPASESTASVAAVALALLLLTGAAPIAAANDGGTGGALAGTDPGGVVAQSNDGPENRTLVAMQPRIVELFPNPTAAENRGEYLVVRLPERGNWSLSDGYHEAEIPANASGVVALSMDPANTTALLDDENAIAGSGGVGEPALRALDGYFPLAASGDRIELRRNGTAVAVVEYDRAPEGHRWRADWGEWRPRGYDSRPATETENATVRPFVLPDSPGMPVDPLRAADDRLLLAGYTLGSERVADLLVAAADRGVDVQVLVEGSPVGGFSARSARLLDRIAAAGVEVRVLDGDPERFRFHHAKYAVADDRAVVLTENWKPSGTGGRTNRGWGVVTGGPRSSGGDETAADETATNETATNETAADDLATLFREDAAAPDARSWSSFRNETEFHASGAANGSYPTRFEPPAATTADVELLTTPGNAADRLVERIDAADDRVLGVVPQTGGPDNRIVRALRRAADRGVDVHLLVSGAWYDRETNRALVDELDDEPIEVTISEPRGRFGKVHAKGLVVDDDAVVGSLNWNEGAATENREVLLAVEDEAVADFYARAYAADWRGGGVHLPIGLLGGLATAVAGAGAVARREVTFA